MCMATKKLTAAQRSKLWRQKNPERVNAYARLYAKRPHVKHKQAQASRLWRQKNRKHMRTYYKKYGQQPKQMAYKKKYWRKNKKYLSRAFKEWSQKNRHTVRKAGYRYFKRHKKVVHKRNKIYRQQNMDKVLFWIRRRKTARLKTKGQHTLQEWLKLRKKTNGVCPCCKERVGLTKLTPDHIIPLAKGGSDYIWNIQPLCKKCNSSKGARHTKKY